MRAITLINGRAWAWTHDGWTYQAVHLNGTSRVHLHYREYGSEQWQYGHSRDTSGRGARGVARAMYERITDAPCTCDGIAARCTCSDRCADCAAVERLNGAFAWHTLQLPAG